MSVPPRGRITHRATFQLNLTPEQLAMVDELIAEGHFQNQERIDFLERTTGLPFRIADDASEIT